MQRATLPLPWLDRQGHFATLKASAFAGVLAPALWLFLGLITDQLGSRPLSTILHQSGLWSIRFLVLSLALTPLSQALGTTRLSAIRRIIGVAVFAYAALHFLLYIIDQQADFTKLTTEILTRTYLTIGFFAFCGLFLLAVTSTDRMIARLGTENWRRIQSLTYAIALLATVHFFMQVKVDVGEPLWVGGLFALLIAIRLARKWARDLSAATYALLALLAAAGTALCEALWYHFSVGAPVVQILLANTDTSLGPRPSWFVLLGGLILAFVRLFRAPLPKRGRRG